MHLPEDPVVCIVEQLDPRTVAGSRALFACMQSSTTLFSFAAPILWSAQVSLDIFKGLTVRCGTSSMMHIEVDTDALAQIERANVLGEEIRVGSLPWRWRNYLRSVRSITLHLAFSLGIRKVEMVASALGPHLPASFDAAQVSTGRGYGFLAEESVARQREWAEWLLNRPHGRAVRHVILEDMSPAEMEPFLQLRMKKLTWLRDRNARHDIVSALGKINDLEALVLGEPHGTYFDIYHTELYKITDVVKSFRAFRSLCLNTGCLPSKIDNGFQLKLTQFSYLMEDDDMETLGVILKASRSQMKEFRVLCGDLFQHTAFWGILSIMTSLTKIELLIPDLNITDLSSTILKLTNLQELYFCFDSVSGTLGDDVVCLPKLRHLKVKGNYEKPKNLRVNFGLGLKTISINNAVLVFDFESLSITGMPHLEELMLENDASVAPTAGFPLFDVCLAEMLEDAAASPALARVEGMTIQRLERHVNELRYGHA
ncbi:hypothetical protein HK101_010071 [Irineochytrium annulatum]|nr:hypothetical protein HK101_010071 [Irineochytrium annulatum]